MTPNKKRFPPTLYNFCFLCVKNRGHIFAYSYMCILCSHFIFLFYIFWVTFNLHWNQMKILFSCLLFYFQKSFNLAETEQVHRAMRECLPQPSPEQDNRKLWYCTWTWWSIHTPLPFHPAEWSGLNAVILLSSIKLFSPLSHHIAFRVLISRPGIGPTVVKMLSPNHWMVREFHPLPLFFTFLKFIFIKLF